MKPGKGRRAPEPPNKGALRIVAGEFGGRRIDTPGGDTSRPTSDRVREAIFNALASMDALDGAVVLDAFAGSGALGLEALSRGASHVTFVDSGPAALSVLETNISLLRAGERTTLRRGDGKSVLLTRSDWDLVLLDPPYEFEGWPELLAAVADHLADDGVVVVESDRQIDAPEGLDVPRIREYGSTVVAFMTRTGADL